jgi:tetratricopeptide (TPR) repeat protein
VGSQSCAKCHADIAEQFAEHPMAMSTRRIEDDENPQIEKGLPAFVKGTQRVLKVALDEGKIAHFEQMYDASGKLMYEQKHPLEYVVGSGRRAKAYVEHRGSLLFMSPVNWYHNSGKWSLAPGYAPDDIRRFDRRITDDCVACHAGRVASKDGRSSVYEDTPFHEMAIGCERCHGPGSNHIEIQEHGASAGKVDSIVSPSKLDAEHREAVCNQCHLEAAARVLRPNKSHLDFRPGMALSDVWAILDQGTDFTAEGHTRSVNHVQQMRDSTCFKGGERKLGCISCHDPHRVPPVEQRAEFYRAKCLACHQEDACTAALLLRQEKQNDCITCHMPKLDSKNMSHVVQTDHRVLRRQSSAPPASGAKATSLNYFADSATKFSPEDRQRGLILGTIIHCKRKGIPLPDGIMIQLERVLQHFPQDVAILNELGAIALQRNDLTAARNFFEKAVAANGRDEAALDGLLDTSYAVADWKTSVRCATQLIEIDSSNTRVYAMLGDALANLGQVDEGIAAVRKAVELNPGASILREWLVKKYSERGLTELLNSEVEMVDRIRGSKVPSRAEDFK